MNIEIIARGPSRTSPRQGFNHWYVSTALKSAEGLKFGDKIFNLHGDDMLEEWLPDNHYTVTMGRSVKLPNANFIRQEYFVENYDPTFACSIAWMLAYALVLGASRIHLNGVDHLRESERKERESIAFWCGMAKATGIEITTSPAAGFRPLWGVYPKK